MQLASKEKSMLEPPRAWGLTLTSLLASCSPPLSALPLSPSLSLSLSLSDQHAIVLQSAQKCCNVTPTKIQLIVVLQFKMLLELF